MQNTAIALLCGALYCPVTDYDPSRDALRDIHEAVAWAAVGPGYNKQPPRTDLN
jgi:hypothetical protein